MVHLGELAALAAQQPHVILTVFNDGGYGILRNMQEAKGAPHRGVDLFTPDFGDLARAFGLPHTLVGSPEAFDRALADAVRRSGPSVIEVDVTALTPAPEPVLPAVDVP